MNRHVAADERFADWVDGRLDEVQRDRFEAELRVNAELRAAAEAYRRSVRAVQDSLRDGDGMGPAFADRLMARIAAETRARRLRWVPFFGSAAAAALLVGLWFAVREFRGTPQQADELARLREGERGAGSTWTGPERFFTRDADRDALESAESTPAERKLAEGKPAESKDFGDVAGRASTAGDLGAPSGAGRVESTDDPLALGARVADETLGRINDEAERAKVEAAAEGGAPTPDLSLGALRFAGEVPTPMEQIDPNSAFYSATIASSVDAPLVLLVELPDDAALLDAPTQPSGAGTAGSPDTRSDGFAQGLVAGGEVESTRLAQERARGEALQFFAAPFVQLQESTANVLPPRLAPMQVQARAPAPALPGSSAQPAPDPETVDEQGASRKDKEVSPTATTAVAAPTDQLPGPGAYHPQPGDQVFLLEGDLAQFNQYLRALAPQVRDQKGTLAVQRAFDLIAVDDSLANAETDNTPVAEEEKTAETRFRRRLAAAEELARSNHARAARSEAEPPPDQLRKQRAATQTWVVLRRVPR